MVILWRMKISLNKGYGLIDQIKIGLGIVLLAALTGCVGYVDPGYGGVIVAPVPEVYIFGGSYERGRDVYEYSHRGYQSRSVAYPARRGPERRR